MIGFVIWYAFIVVWWFILGFPYVAAALVVGIPAGYAFGFLDAKNHE